MTKETVLNPAMLAEQARAKGTPVIELEACDKCRNPEAIYFYQREGRTHNGCLWCRHVEGKALLSANSNSAFLTAVMVDENDEPIRMGRACAVCGSKVRLVNAAYGAKNKGACRECSIHQQTEKQMGKEFKRLNRTVSNKVHKFVVQSIERSGVVEVAPQSFAEFIEVRELAYRCQMMNEREQRLNTGIRWELGHKFPAAGTAERSDLRGKTTVENLYLVQMEQNRREGNVSPDDWEVKQVVSIADCRAIQRSYEASQAWKEVKGSWSNDTAAAKKERQQKEKQAQEEHAERVRKVVGETVRVMEFFAVEDLLSFNQMLETVRARWDKMTVKMDRVITGFIQSGRNLPFTEAREQRLTVEAFCGATARLHAVVMTLNQIADAEKIILSGDDVTEEQREQIETVKRCAVLWGRDVLNNDNVLVMGFTHPLLSVVGDAYAWGTVEDENTGKQWLCAWQNQTRNLQDELTPFDNPETAIDESRVNPALTHKSGFLTLDTVKVWGEGWNNTETIYLYEQAEKVKARKAREEQKARQEAAQNAQRAAERAMASKGITSQIESLRSDWATWEGELYAFAAGEFQEALQFDAYSLIDEAREKVNHHVSELENLLASDGDLQSEWRWWQMTNSQKMKGMLYPQNVFADLLHPF
ncbi:hypothetical protein QO636_004500 [Salmonella enterica]|nr:hypothetical protein [Salmonella enterica]